MRLTSKGRSPRWTSISNSLTTPRTVSESRSTSHQPAGCHCSNEPRFHVTQPSSAGLRHHQITVRSSKVVQKPWLLRLPSILKTFAGLALRSLHMKFAEPVHVASCSGSRRHSKRFHSRKTGPSPHHWPVTTSIQEIVVISWLNW